MYRVIYTILYVQYTLEYWIKQMCLEISDEYQSGNISNTIE